MPALALPPFLQRHFTISLFDDAEQELGPETIFAAIIRELRR
jgi:hypothetical protein